MEEEVTGSERCGKVGGRKWREVEGSGGKWREVEGSEGKGGRSDGKGVWDRAR